MAKVKCRHCGKSIEKSTSVREEYLQTKALKIANRYFCNQTCYDEFHFEDKIKDDFNTISSEVLEIDTSKNKYFKTRMKNISDIRKAYLVINKKKDEFIPEFKTEIKKIKERKVVAKNYEIAVYINLLENYIIKYVCGNEETDESVVLNDYIDYEAAMPKGIQAKKRKTIFDMEE